MKRDKLLHLKMFKIKGLSLLQVQLILGDSLLIGVSRVEVLVLTLARQTKPNLSGKTSVIWPIIHTFLGVDSSTTTTVSPTAKFLFGRNHFWRSCNRGRYSLFQRPQKTSAKYCTCRHLLREYISLFTNRPG